MPTASWYHCSVKPISRSSGRTAVASAAYRAGTRLHDEQLGKTYDYTRRHGVETAFIVAPEHSPEWAYNLERLWNEAQAKDNRKNSCLARECELALPSSLDATDREALAREFAHHLVERYGVAVSIALHEPSRYGDERNYHAHILFTTRRMDANGLGAKTRELDDRHTGPQEIIHLREYTASLINDYLETAGVEERVDHRSFEERGVMQEPTHHLGVEASAMERRGEESRIGDENRNIMEHNHRLDMLVDELATLDAEIAAEMAERFLPDYEQVESDVVGPIESDSLLPTVLLEVLPSVHEPEPPTLSWQEQKVLAQSAFKDMGLDYPADTVQTVAEEDPALTWQECKEQAQSAFREVEDPLPDAPPTPSGESWEETKRVAQSAFDSPEVNAYFQTLHHEIVSPMNPPSSSNPAQKDKASPGPFEQSMQSWEDQKREAQGAFEEAQRLYGITDASVAYASPSVLSWEEQKRQAQSAFHDPIVKGHIESIQQAGAVKEYGTGKNWYDRGVAFFETMYYTMTERLKGAYQRFVGRHFSTPNRMDFDLDR